MSTFLNDINAAILARWSEQGTPLANLCKAIEVGSIEPEEAREVEAHRLPLFALKSIGLGPDSREQSGTMRTNIRVRCRIVAGAARLTDAEDIVLEIIATAFTEVGRESMGNRFGIGSALNNCIQDCYADANGGILAVVVADGEDVTFTVVGEFEFGVEYLVVVEAT